MNTVNSAVRPKSFWMVAVLALLWNLLGVAMFAMQMMMTPEALAAMPAEQRQVYEATPSWLNIAFAVAVFGGVLGALGLLLKKRWAVLFFTLSLIGLLAQVIATFLVTPVWQAYGPAGLVMPVLLIVIALLLLGYSRKAAARGWLE
ncbi:MAG TPA: hypothetical protein VLG17_20215 [Pseudomonas sp.]|uniref:hypothetical protein n=1 Tax=Pseudomonas sp. TaxID=306 RepID=UPI002C84B2D7|nr:hypothetical protein [Pseudomonas sp.]HSX90310.1 hypothetical protein [Pseudomonas sp.]